jgi:hypothetical protein
MQTANDNIGFSSTSGSGPQSASKSVSMGASVTKATAILTGFKAQFSNGDDHHLGLLQVQVWVAPGGISGSDVTVNASYGLRDWSGDWDDAYDGVVYFTVVGE